MQVDILPSQARDISQPLACVETKENHRTPLIVSDAENRFQFRNREWAANSGLALSDSGYELCRIIADQSITPRSTKNHPEKLDLVIHCFRREPFCLLISKARDMFAGNFCQIGISSVPQEGEELICCVSIEHES